MNTRRLLHNLLTETAQQQMAEQTGQIVRQKIREAGGEGSGADPAAAPVIDPAAVMSAAIEKTLAAEAATAKPWWQSRTIIGAMVAIAAQILLAVAPEIHIDQVALTDLILQITTVLGSALAVYGRARASRPIRLQGPPRSAAPPPGP